MHQVLLIDLSCKSLIAIFEVFYEVLEALNLVLIDLHVRIVDAHISSKLIIFSHDLLSIGLGTLKIFGQIIQCFG